MRQQVSNCFYHPDRSAVATCSKCGVGICEYCAVKDVQGKIVCYRCGNEDLKQEHKEYRKSLKERGGRFRKGTEFIVPGIVGTLLVVLSFILLKYSAENGTGSLSSIIDGWEKMLVNAILAYFIFSLPFCYILLNDLFAPKYDTAHNNFGKFLLKILISFLFGWLVFTFLWIRFIVRKIMSSKSKN